MLPGKNPPNVFTISFVPGVFATDYICVASSELFFNICFARFLANFSFLQLVFTRSPWGTGIKKGLPGVASLLFFLCSGMAFTSRMKVSGYATTNYFL
jgi:hypothetical protein